MKSSAYYFHIKTKILADFQICISVPLTPNHLIYGRSLYSVNENDLVEITENEMGTIKVFTTNLLKKFMGKFKHEYLLVLQQRLV